MDEVQEGLTMEIYKALMGGENDKVIQLCRQAPKGGLHILTIHGSTVLHMAAYAQENKLVIDLLNELPEEYFHELTTTNDSGNTILHEMVTSNYEIAAAKIILHRAPELLSMLNKRGETPLFRAARYGKSRMFMFLDHEVHKVVTSEEHRRSFLICNATTTALHAAILTEHFDLALLIAEKYNFLTHEQDKDGTTGLQLLACNPTAFRSGDSLNLLQRLLYSRGSIYEDISVSIEGVSAIETDEPWCKLPFWDELRKRERNYESAFKLAKILIESDKTWGITRSAEEKSLPTIHKYGKALQDQKLSKEELPKTKMEHKHSSAIIPETPLFLATKSGCIEIVQGILDRYPQAVSHVDHQGRNILHVAIRHRQIKIFDVVEKKKISMSRLRQKIDKDGNSILHMVGEKTEGVHVHRDMRSPAVILQEDLLLFERIEKISAKHHTKHLNSKGKTAERLLTDNNAELHTDAKEWVKRTAENCSIVAVLIATVAFAAAYTVPGGQNEKGIPILEKSPLFVLFTIADVLSLGLALTSVIIFLSILTSPFRLKDFRQSLPQKLMFGVTMMILSISMMMMAFAATVILLIRNREKWTRISLYTVAFLPVSIFTISYLPLYLSLMGTFKYTLKKIGLFIPHFRTPAIFIKSQALVHHKCCSQPQTSCCLL